MSQKIFLYKIVPCQFFAIIETTPVVQDALPKARLAGPVACTTYICPGYFPNLRPGLKSEPLRMEKDSFIVAVPSKWPGGVDSQPALGLTTCDCFSLFAIENGGIHHTIVLPNPPDRYSGCGRRIDILHSFGTNKVLLKNAGKRALLKLDKCGIKSLNCEQGSVRHAVEKCLKGTLEATRISGACHKLPEGAVPEDCRFNELSLDSPCQCPYGMCGERSVLRTED